MASEVELHDAVQELGVIATAPDVYPTLVELQCVSSLMSLLSHEVNLWFITQKRSTHSQIFILLECRHLCCCFGPSSRIDRCWHSTRIWGGYRGTCYCSLRRTGTFLMWWTNVHQWNHSMKKGVRKSCPESRSSKRVHQGGKWGDPQHFSYYWKSGNNSIFLKSCMKKVQVCL